MAKNNYTSNLINIDFTKLSDEQLNQIINEGNNKSESTGEIHAAGYDLPMLEVCKVLVKDFTVKAFSDNFKFTLKCEHNKQPLQIGFSAKNKTYDNFTTQFVKIFNLGRALLPNQLVDEMHKALKANPKGFYVLVRREYFNNGSVGTWYNFSYDALMHEYIKEQALSVMQKRAEKKGE